MNTTPIDLVPVLIRARQLTKTFGNFTAVKSIDFDIRQGEILGFLGPNGAGKTTTIRMIMGLLQATSGSIFIKGYDSRTERRRIKGFLGYMSQKYFLYPLLTAEENAEFFGGIAGLDASTIRLRQTRLREQIGAQLTRLKVQDLPPGIRQKVALHVCLMNEPEIILLDEPTSGVDPEVRREFWLEIYRLKKRGRTIMVTTHNLDEAEYADRILIINRGEIILTGDPQDLVERRGTGTMEDLFKEAVSRHGQN